MLDRVVIAEFKHTCSERGYVEMSRVGGIHSITYDSPADCITIAHDAHSREGFALGAVLAAEYTLTHQGLLSTDDLFSF